MHALIQLKTSKDRARAATSAKNLFICGSAILVCVSPFLFLARDAIYNYYVVGHFLSAEKYIRAAEQGVRSLWDDLTYYPWSVAVTSRLAKLLFDGDLVVRRDCDLSPERLLWHTPGG